MKAFIVIVLLYFCSSIVHAQWLVVPLQTEMRISKASDANYEHAIQYGLSVGRFYEKWLGVMEYSKFSSDDNNGAMKVETQTQEIRSGLWYDPWGHKIIRENLTLRLGVGVNTYQENITSIVMASTDKVTTKWKSNWFAGLMLERQMQFYGNTFSVSLETKVLFAKQLQQEPIYLPTLKLGMLF